MSRLIFRGTWQHAAFAILTPHFFFICASSGSGMRCRHRCWRGIISLMLSIFTLMLTVTTFAFFAYAAAVTPSVSLDDFFRCQRAAARVHYSRAAYDAPPALLCAARLFDAAAMIRRRLPCRPRCCQIFAVDATPFALLMPCYAAACCYTF